MPTAILFDPRLWLYAAVVGVFALSALVVLVSALAVFVVIVTVIGVSAIYRKLSGFSSINAANDQERGLLLLEELALIESTDPAPERELNILQLKGSAPHDWAYARAPNGMGMGNEISGPHPITRQRRQLKPLDRSRKSRNRSRRKATG